MDGKESGARTGMGPSATRPAQAHPGTSRVRAPKPLTGQCRHGPRSHLTPSSPWTPRWFHCRLRRTWPARLRWRISEDWRARGITTVLYGGCPKDLSFVRVEEVKLDTPHEKARLDGGVTVAAAWRPHTGESCPGAAAPP
jgi:hypothetical protein